MKYFEIREREKQFLSLTGLLVPEFDHLIPLFHEQWRNFYRIYTIQGHRRKMPLMNPMKDTPTLPSLEEKLFFILVYLKNHSLQEMMAASFGFSQSQASKWQKILCPLLCRTLDKLGMLPLRDGHKVAQKLEALGETKCFQDASERLIERPGDYETQKEFYTRKKKGHTVKNNFITTQSQFVIYMSPTFEGKMHDKKIADEDQVIFPDNIQLFQDLGYQGFRPDNVHIVQPFRKPPKAELSPLQIWFNEYVAKIRICIEHAISGIKRCRFVKDKCRHFLPQFRDQVINICTGLHNFRVCSPLRNYNCSHKWALTFNSE